jgi:hypothetical protein
MTLAFEKTVLMILLTILLILLAISGVYGAYSLILGDGGAQLPGSNHTMVMMVGFGIFILSALGLIPIIVALRRQPKHKKRVHA